MPWRKTWFAERGALKQLLEVRVGEQLPGGHGIEIAVIDTIDLRHRIQAQLGDRIQEARHRQHVRRGQAGWWWLAATVGR